MTMNAFNQLDKNLQREALMRCCGATSWVKAMMNAIPFNDKLSLFQTAERAWYQGGEADWKEAFTHHPKIGDLESFSKKFAATSDWAKGEQAKVNEADQSTLRALQSGNQAYEKKFGYIYIVCATGKTATEMLELLQSRLPNDPVTEIKIAMEEQMKITRIRLDKLLA